jgi:hypothetical protein
MEMRKLKLQEADKEVVLNNFLETFDKECEVEVFGIDPDFATNGFYTLDEFYLEFNKDVKEREINLQHKLCNSVMLREEYEELEEIALVKYPGITLDEVENFYLFCNTNEREELARDLSNEFNMVEN